MGGKHACGAGEIGSSLKDPADQAYYKDLAPYLTQARPGIPAAAAASDRAPPNAAAVPSGWFWWAYNANSNSERETWVGQRGSAYG